MVTVTQRIRQVSQPHGGYINPRTMEVRYAIGGAPSPLDHKAENIHASLVGMAVDYLTRYALSEGPGWERAEGAFSISLLGARMVGEEDYARELCKALNNELDRVNKRPGDPSTDLWVPSLRDAKTGEVFENKRVSIPSAEAIAIAIKLASYDSAFRAGPGAYNPDAITTPDSTTTQNISTMVARSLAFFRAFGPVLVDGFTMPGGYTQTVTAGDGDFITADTLWDFKVSVSPPTKDHTLQLLIYWLMGRESGWNWGATARTRGEPIPTHLGIYNPRLDAVYRLPVASIPDEIISAVARDVIGYR